MSSETRLTSKNSQDMSRDTGSDQKRKFWTEYITYAVLPYGWEVCGRWSVEVLASLHDEGCIADGGAFRDA